MILKDPLLDFYFSYANQEGESKLVTISRYPKDKDIVRQSVFW